LFAFERKKDGWVNESGFSGESQAFIRGSAAERKEVMRSGEKS